MIFSQNYLNFFDIQTSTKEQFEKSQEDFVYNMWEFLNHITGWNHRPKNSKIAESVFDMMTSSDLHYHTPIHVLAIFQQAKNMNIDLRKHEILAIWFHDVIYYIGSDRNEINSCHYMTSLLKESVQEDMLNKAVMIIQATANHFKKNEEIEIGHLVLDMDIASIGGPPDFYNSVSDCIKKEYPQISLEDFNTARMNFMKKIAEKGYIYRTEYFKQFEEQAKKNLGI